jgi:hypothetical protein
MIWKSYNVLILRPVNDVVVYGTVLFCRSMVLNKHYN